MLLPRAKLILASEKILTKTSLSPIPYELLGLAYSILSKMLRLGVSQAHKGQSERSFYPEFLESKYHMRKKSG